nr:MAG TPA: hypothetical protein [Caudoviricetes sp.]
MPGLIRSIEYNQFITDKAHQLLFMVGGFN